MELDSELPPEPPPSASTPPAEAPITQCLTHLQAPSDTARFVGLAMLSSILKNENIAKDRSILRKLWESMPYKFLDRLLKSRHSSKTPVDQAADMVELAVNVIHAFSLLLPAAAEESSLVARAPRLVAALSLSSEPTKITILETLSVFATREKGAESIMASDITPLLETSLSLEQGSQVVLYSLINGTNSETGLGLVTKVLPGILQQYSEALSKGMTAEDRPARLRLLSFFSELLPRLASPLLPTSTTWVTHIYAAIRHALTATHSSTERSHATIICATLLQTYPPTLLFHPPSKSTASSKPFTPFFIRLLLIDIRSSIPSLMEQLSSPTYPVTAHRLACDFDVIAAFIGYLVQLDEPFETTEMDPEALLKFRGEMGETLSLTIEFLRDRWDAKFAGASGYQMDTSGDGKDEAKEAPRSGKSLSIAWDAAGIEGGLVRDPIITSSIRALSLWLREDDSLRKEAGGLMDLFLGLWKQSTEKQAEIGGIVDYRLWIVSALEGTLTEKNGRELFKQFGGWELLWAEAKHFYLSSSQSTSISSPPDLEMVKLAIEVVRVLVEFVKESDYLSIPHLETKLLEVAQVARITRLHGQSEEMSRVWLGLDVGVLRLASALLKKAPQGSHISRREEVKGKVERMTKELGELVHANGERTEMEEQEEVVFVLAEVMEELGLV